MKSKGFVIALTVVVTLLCIYYLSFTLVSYNVRENARTYATSSKGKVDFAKKQRYLDSIYNKPVYNLFGVNYTYKEVTESELKLGLDLQGGMHVTLEVSPADILLGLSSGNEDKNFHKALEMAAEKQKHSQSKYLDLFYESFKELAPDQKLSSIFATSANRGRVSFKSTDEEVLKFLRSEVESAMDRAFQILRTRIDRFGTSQPNIQRLQGTGRIQIELPGVDNPKRVRKLLQGVAKLEFLEVYEMNQLAPYLQEINKKLVAEQKEKADETKANGTAGKQTSKKDALQGLSMSDSDTAKAASDTTGNELAKQLEEKDTSGESSLDSLQNSQLSPLFSKLKSQYGLVYDVKDTMAINKIFERPDIQALLPHNMRLCWDVKPKSSQGSEKVLELYALRTLRGNEAPLTGEVVTGATQTFDQVGKPAVDMSMNAEGARKWKKLTSENINKRLAIVLDNYVYSAPVVNSEIPNGKSIIQGNFTIEEAKDLANILEAGSLPAPTRIVEEAIIGPTLGKEAQAQGIVSVVSGLVIVLLFMIAYYSKGGIVANIALVFNIFFILGILAQFSASLTLPGIAGIVLTIGMSVDANVLIFERIREEMKSGGSLIRSIAAGYEKAYSSIVDANVTTFLTGVILYVLGQGPVKGFAVTLMIGIVCSFFSAVFITRVIVGWMTKKGEKSKISFDTKLSRGLFNNVNIDFVGKRRTAYIISGSVIAFGLVMLMIDGLNLGVDFKGGRSYVVSFSKPVVPSKLKVALDDDFKGKGTEVKTYGANNVLKITTSYLVDEESSEADDQVKQSMVKGVEDFTHMHFVEDGGANLPPDSFTISGSSKVGATIADDIKNASEEAVIFSLIVIFLYILIRFRSWQFGLGAIVALFHDTLIVLGAFAIVQLFGINFEVDQVFIAAMLTIIGYSINDTVVVFDRIRETLNSTLTGSRNEKFNKAINDTLGRTTMTSFTTLIVVLILLLFGGEVLRGFSFALFIGIVTGTYSSVFVATPIVIDFESKKKKEIEKKK